MTERQRELLTFIRGYRRQHGYPPTLDEMAKGIGLTHRSTVHAHCQKLVEAGQLEARPLLGGNRYFPVEQDPLAA